MPLFNVGDSVIYDSECFDHWECGELFVGDTYTILAVQSYNSYGNSIYDDEEDEEIFETLYLLDEACWWVEERHLVSIVEGNKETKQDAVIRKIKSMEAKRKALGYKW